MCVFVLCYRCNFRSYDKDESTFWLRLIGRISEKWEIRKCKINSPRMTSDLWNLRSCKCRLNIWRWKCCQFHVWKQVFTSFLQRKCLKIHQDSGGSEWRNVGRRLTAAYAKHRQLFEATTDTDRIKTTTHIHANQLPSHDRNPSTNMTAHWYIERQNNNIQVRAFT